MRLQVSGDLFFELLAVLPNPSLKSKVFIYKMVH